MLTVACVLKSGGIYDPSWVAKLKAAVRQHLSEPHDFVCLSDVDVSCDRIPLEHDWPGWWAKMEVYRLKGPVIFFDLDTLPIGDLSDLAAHAAKKGFSALQDFYRPHGIGSGVMTWSAAADMTNVYETFRDDAAAIMKQIGSRGDQGVLEEMNVPAWRLQFSLGRQIVSYKVHCQQGIPPGARVVCLHGVPKFLDMPSTDPVRQLWESL